MGEHHRVGPLKIRSLVHSGHGVHMGDPWVETSGARRRPTVDTGKRTPKKRSFPSDETGTVPFDSRLLLTGCSSGTGHRPSCNDPSTGTGLSTLTYRICQGICKGVPTRGRWPSSLTELVCMGSGRKTRDGKNGDGSRKTLVEGSRESRSSVPVEDPPEPVVGPTSSVSEHLRRPDKTQ